MDQNTRWAHSEKLASRLTCVAKLFALLLALVFIAGEIFALIHEAIKPTVPAHHIVSA